MMVAFYPETMEHSAIEARMTDLGEGLCLVAMGMARRLAWFYGTG